MAPYLTQIIASHSIAAPTAAPTEIDYTPPGGWESIDYPDGTGENLPYYPPPPGGWENVNYPPGTGGNCAPSSFPFTFTSTYAVVATGAEVLNGTTSVPGPEDAVGYFNYGINSIEDTICYV
jgi:hypothetical protein